jgi:hypothetical protein
MTASAHGHLEIGRMLILAGADVSAGDVSVSTKSVISYCAGCCERRVYTQQFVCALKQSATLIRAQRHSFITAVFPSACSDKPYVFWTRRNSRR